MKLLIPLVIPGLALSVSLGCAARSYAPLEAKVESMQSVRQALEEARVQTDRVLSSLNKVVAWADRDPRPAMDEFEGDLEKLGELAEEASDRSKAMREASEEYFQSWQEENAQMKTEGLQELSTDRMSAARASWRDVQDEAMAMSDAFQEYLERLRELRGYLASNLSPSGIEAARPYIERAERSGMDLRDRIAELTSRIDRMAARVAPAGSEG